MRFGYERSTSEKRELNMDAWRRARSIMFAGAAPYMTNKSLSIYDFFPLPGDPTAEELRAIVLEEQRKFKETMDKKMAELLAQGYLTQNITVQA